MIDAGFASFFGLGLEDGHLPTFRSLLYTLADLTEIKRVNGEYTIPGLQKYVDSRALAMCFF